MKLNCQFYSTLSHDALNIFDGLPEPKNTLRDVTTDFPLLKMPSSVLRRLRMCELNTIIHRSSVLFRHQCKVVGTNCHRTRW